jgi:hypothetical protein
MRRFCLLLLVLFAGVTKVTAQAIVRITGVVKDSLGVVLPKATVNVMGQGQFTMTDKSGIYNTYSTTSSFTLKFTLLGYNPVLVEIRDRNAEKMTIDVVMVTDINELEQVTITNKRNQLSNAAMLNVKDLSGIPSVSGNFEVVLKTLPGVSTNNELSSQYSVRGGNFDENLVYVNDVEISRPVLIRNGQQEGLSFINSDLLSSAKFSAGGFESRYGDKLSSVLDVKYERPDSNQQVLNIGLMASSLSLKTSIKNSFLLAGLRYKNNGNVLNTQDNKGTYTPNFKDFQLVYSRFLSSKFNLSFLGSFNTGVFKLFPESRETQFGTLNTRLRLSTDYSGKELDEYTTAGAAVTATWYSKSNVVLKLINSYFRVVEDERIDIEGRYVFDELSTGNFGAIRTNRGIGGYTNYARNSLTSQIFSTGLKADKMYENHTFSIGARFEHKNYIDNLNEYSLIDSAGYIIEGIRNFYQDNAISVKNRISIQNLTAYIQDSYSISSNTDLQLGLRTSFNSLSSQLLLSPRLLLAYRPADNTRIWRFTAGVYQQAPDYRSIRGFDGILNLRQKAQRSYNTSAGLDWAFDGLGTRLKFTSELYFKYQDRLIPYMMDNVRIKYLANDLAKGYTYGADFSVGGEFVKDLLSYFRVSFMKANQLIVGDNRGYLKRPTDQRVNLSVYFQDRLLNSPTYKVHLTMLYGSRLPIGAPLLQRYSDDFSIPAYKRVDIGFSKDFLDDAVQRRAKFLDKYFSSFATHVEVFNLLNIDNTVSYLWLRDVNNVQYAIPNYLTGRQLNVKLIIKFKNSK